MPDSCPIWSLRDLYDGVDSPALQTDIAACRKDALALAADWQGKIATISGAELADVITAYEAILEQLGKVQSHAQLLFAANTNDPAIAKHHQSVREAGSEIGAALLFVELELARLDQDHVDGLLDDAGLARFSPWLRRVRAMAPYQLSDEIEKMIDDEIEKIIDEIQLLLASKDRKYEDFRAFLSPPLLITYNSPISSSNSSFFGDSSKSCIETKSASGNLLLSLNE